MLYNGFFLHQILAAALKSPTDRYKNQKPSHAWARSGVGKLELNGDSRRETPIKPNTWSDLSETQYKY